MVSQGPNNPGTMANDDTVGTVDWANPDRAKISDDSYAQWLELGTTIHYLKATNFGFSIPTGATINGILVEIEQIREADATENSIKIVKGGIISGDEKSTGAELPDVEAYVSYGASDNLWGLSWTAEDINLSTFGVVYSAKRTVLDVVGVDHIRITVYYTTSILGPAPRDENRVPTFQAVLDTDGETPTNVLVDPTVHAFMVDDDTTGSDNGPTNAKRDDNRVPVAMVVSESDGTTPVALYADSSGNLLIDST